MPFKITELLNEQFQKYGRIFLFLLLLVSFSILAYYSYHKFIFPKLKKPVNKDIANVNTRAKTVELLFFHANWCPHCKKAEPEWKAFCDEYNGQIVNNYSVICRDIDCSDPDNSISNEFKENYNIEHFPTLKMIIDTEIIDFDSKITKDTLTKFVKTLTAGNN